MSQDIFTKKWWEKIKGYYAGTPSDEDVHAHIEQASSGVDLLCIFWSEAKLLNMGANDYHFSSQGYSRLPITRVNPFHIALALEGQLNGMCASWCQLPDPAAKLAIMEVEKEALRQSVAEFLRKMKDLEDAGLWEVVPHKQFLPLIEEFKKTYSKKPSRKGMPKSW